MLVLFTLTLRQPLVQQGWVPHMEFYILHREIIDDAISVFHLCYSLETLKTSPPLKLKHP